MVLHVEAELIGTYTTDALVDPRWTETKTCCRSLSYAIPDGTVSKSP